MDGLPDRGGVSIWPLLPSDSTGWHETLTSHQSEILHSLIFYFGNVMFLKMWCHIVGIWVMFNLQIVIIVCCTYHSHVVFIMDSWISLAVCRIFSFIWRKLDFYVEFNSVLMYNKSVLINVLLNFTTDHISLFSFWHCDVVNVFQTKSKRGRAFDLTYL